MSGGGGALVVVMLAGGRPTPLLRWPGALRAALGG